VNAPQLGQPARRSGRRLTLAVLATAQFLVVLSTSIVNVALPSIRSGLGMSPAGLSWVINAYVLVFGGPLLLTAGLLWLSRTPEDGTFLADLLGPSLLIGAGVGTTFVQLTELSAAGVAARDSGVAGGLINASRQIGGAIGLALLATVSARSGYGAAFLACAALVLLTALLSITTVKTPAIDPR